jgi:protein-L-isoaspartate O-methyltransferase
MVERLVPGEPEWAEFSAPHLARYLFAAEYARGRRVLDAGTGSGYGARNLR